jgi:hypothetical protein
MSNMLKCPNPSCPYVFDPSQVPVGVILSCPRCGMQFTLGPPAAGPQQPPTNPPASPTHQPAPAEEPNPEFEEVGRTAVKERTGRRRDAGEAEPEPGTDYPPRGNNNALLFILVGLAAVLMAGTALALYFLWPRGGDNTVPPDTITRLQDLNVAIQGVPEGWTRDDNLRVKVGSPHVIAYTRQNPEAYVAFGAAEPGKGRSPRPSEMRADLLGTFPKLFDDRTREEYAPVESSWLGESIAEGHPYPNGFKFRVQSTDGLIWVGEAYTVAHKGIAYYWMGWCNEGDFDALKGEFATFRGKFKLLDTRKNWKETRSNVVDYKGDTVAYTITDAEELWKEVPDRELKPLKEADPDLDKRLRIYLTPKRDRKARPDEAELSVYLLDGAGPDATAAAEKFAKDRETQRIKSSNPDFAAPTFKQLTDAPQGDPTPNTVPAPAAVVRLQSDVKESRDAGRLIVVSGIKVGDKTVVVHSWCEARKRDVFETKFVQIASSLR